MGTNSCYNNRRVSLELLEDGIEDLIRESNLEMPEMIDLFAKLFNKLFFGHDFFIRSYKTKEGDILRAPFMSEVLCDPYKLFIEAINEFSIIKVKRVD